MRWRGTLAGLSLAFLLLALSAHGGEPAPLVERGLVYGKGGSTDLKLDLARPTGDGPFPAIVCLHGGGWRGGKRQDLDTLTQTLAKRNFVAITVSYRFSQEAPFPAQIEDCKTAVRWLRANAAKYRVRSDRVGAVGFSAGAHLACLLGTADAEAKLEGIGGHAKESSRVQAVVSYFGPTDFAVKTWNKQVEDYFLVPFLGGPFEAKRSLYEKASPLRYVSSDDPPFLFFHGAKDTLVGLENSVKMVKKLREVGVEAELVTLPEDGHGWIGEKMRKTVEQTIRFFEAKLQK
jgi:acetyl esterase/lipase